LGCRTCSISIRRLWLEPSGTTTTTRLPRDSLLSRRSPAKEDGEGGWICISAIRMKFTRRGGQAPAETFKEKNLRKMNVKCLDPTMTIYLCATGFFDCSTLNV